MTAPKLPTERARIEARLRAWFDAEREPRWLSYETGEAHTVTLRARSRYVHTTDRGGDWEGSGPDYHTALDRALDAAGAPK